MNRRKMWKESKGKEVKKCKKREKNSKEKKEGKIKIKEIYNEQQGNEEKETK